MADTIDLAADPGKAKDALKAGRSSLEKQLLAGVERVLLLIEADGKRNCPVQDGRLRSSITHSVTETEEQVAGRVGTNVGYAPYVHEGTGIYAEGGNGRQTPWSYIDEKTGERVFTHGQKPNPFLRNAMEQNQGNIAGIFKETVNNT